MFDNPFLSDASLGSAFTPSLRMDARKGELFTVDPGSSGGDMLRATVALGSLIILDFGSTLIGGVIFKPRFLERLVPLGAAMPTFPENEGWQMATRLQVIVDGHGGLRTWLLTGKIVTRSIAQLRILYTYRSEAAQGQIPIYRLAGFKPVEIEFGTFYTPILELAGFADRDENTFGPRLCPSPPPILAASAAPPALPEPAAVEAEAAHEAPTPEPVTTLSPPPPPPPPGPGPDRFAAFRPITTPPVAASPPAAAPSVAAATPTPTTPQPPSTVPPSSRRTAPKKPY